MRKSRKPWTVRTQGAYAGRPRVANDHELYAVIAQMAGEKASVAELDEYMQLWGSPYQDWQLGVIAMRAQLFLGCIRKELGRRTKLDPNQLRLLKGV